MDIRYYLQFAVAVLGLLGGLFSYILGLRIRHDILENNERLEKEITAVKELSSIAINNLRAELTKEFGAIAIRHEDKYERIDRIVSEFTDDKILHVINGKYVRTDLYLQGVSSMQDRFSSMKELIEVNMEKIEHGLDRQIVDLKERIFHSSK